MPDRHGRTTIVVADDDAASRLLLRTTLERAGYVVVEAKDGLEAMTLIQRSRPDLALLDVAMPEVDGFQLTARLRADESTAQLPIILVTALSANEHKVQGANVGATDFVTKPVQRSELLARVRANLPSPT